MNGYRRRERHADGARAPPSRADRAGNGGRRSPRRRHRRGFTAV
jgi:hypothetical protein